MEISKVFKVSKGVFEGSERFQVAITQHHPQRQTLGSKGQGAGAVRYIPAGGASVRDPGSVELLRDTFMVQLATQTQYCSYRRWIGATTTF